MTLRRGKGPANSFRGSTTIPSLHSIDSKGAKMPRSTQRKNKAQGTLIAPSSVLDVIDKLLKEQMKTFPSKIELTEGEIEHWHQDLSPFTARAIEWAFDAWRRNGRFFPVYGDILDLCIAWEPAEAERPLCDAVCKSRHRRGYGEEPFRGVHDVTRLYELIRRKIEAEKRTVEQKFTDEEIEGLLDELDKMRGSSPEWRQQRALEDRQ
jgi:hypothetical protein